MLSDPGRIGRVVAVAVTALIGVGAGLGAGRLIDGRADPVPPALATKVDAVGDSPKSAPEQRGRGGAAIPEASGDATAVKVADPARLVAALNRGAAAAEQLGGRVEAAVLLHGSDTPVIVGPPGKRSRMWSMAKPVAAIAAWRVPQGPTPVVLTAMQEAIQRSENCAQRRVILEVQKFAPGIPEAKRIFKGIVRESRADVMTTNQTAPADEACMDYLGKTGEGLEDPSGPTPLLGTWTWTVADAVQFAAALGNGTYGEPGAAVVRDMARPKRASREVTPMEHTMDPAFGAGKVWPGRRIAYKSGWGGSIQHDFVVGQYGIVGGPDTRLAFAVVFHPDDQPPIDDPGRTRADEAIQAVLKPVKNALAD